MTDKAVDASAVVALLFNELSAGVGAVTTDERQTLDPRYGSGADCVAAGLVQAQSGRPVTAGDLSGKTVCWEDGWRITYAKDGSYFGARGGSPGVNHHNARWSISEPGVVQIDQPGKPRSLQIAVLPDGRYERDQFRAKNKKGMAGIDRNFGALCH